MKQSAGILLYRYEGLEIKFFLVHPGGPFFARKNEGWWSIPKGEINEHEEPLHAALREFEEETGYKPTGSITVLNPIKQKGGKVVFCWAVEGYLDENKIISNIFEIEWPPKSGQLKSFPEIDRAGWFSLSEATILINEMQRGFLYELLDLIKKT